MNLTDKEIITRVHNGEREIFGELHMRYYRRIKHYVSQFIYNLEDAKDVTQEIFLKAYRSIDSFQFRKDSSFIAYLIKISTNQITDYRRKLPPGKLISIDQSSKNSPEIKTQEIKMSQQSYQDNQLQKDKIENVQQALKLLSEEDRQIIYLAYQEDMPRAQIAEVLEMSSVTSVTTKLYRSMQKLKFHLNEIDSAEGGNILPLKKSAFTKGKPNE